MLLLLVFATLAAAFQDNGVRSVQLWPPVHDATFGASTITLDPCTFAFTDNSQPSPSGAGSGVPGAVAMYTPLIFPGAAANCSAASRAAPGLSGLVITAQDPAVLLPTLATDESYILTVPTTGSATLDAATYVGVLRGLETFSQLVLWAAPTPGAPLAFVLPQTPWVIKDHPRFPHRGVLVDPARTFLPIPTLQRVVDGLMWSKLNVLHLHLTDSQSFTMQTPRRAEVYEAGAFSADQFYSIEDIRGLVSYATARGVRIVAETDTPGHARAYGLSDTYKDVVVCGDATGSTWEQFCAEPPCGQLNPASPSLYPLLEGVLADFLDAFPDETLHLGFDEFNSNCWANSTEIQQYMAKNGLNISTLLLEFFVKEQAIVVAADAKRRLTYWEEAALQKPAMPIRPIDIIQVWSNQDALMQVLNTTAASVIVSWYGNVYLDCGLGNMFGADSWCDPFKTWLHIYSTDPLAGFPASELNRALGGEAGAWGELIGPANIETAIWPRAASYGGRLWNYETVLPASNASLALAGHTERLVARGLNAVPPAMHFCKLFPNMCYQ